MLAGARSAKFQVSRSKRQEPINRKGEAGLYLPQAETRRVCGRLFLARLSEAWDQPQNPGLFLARQDHRQQGPGPTRELRAAPTLLDGRSYLGTRIESEERGETHPKAGGIPLTRRARSRVRCSRERRVEGQEPDKTVSRFSMSLFTGSRSEDRALSSGLSTESIRSH